MTLLAAPVEDGTRVVSLAHARARRERQREGAVIEAALRQRVRYRYVQPRIDALGEGWVIHSPCCSRNVDAEGGEIAIAWLQRTPDGQWCLHARDHGAQRWRAHTIDAELQVLLDLVCLDPQREFWP